MYLSNTYSLHKYLGWRGVVIEADPTNFLKMIRNRPFDINLNAAICREPQTVHYVSNLEMGNGAVNGIWEFMSTTFKERFWSNVNISTLPEIPCVPLMPLLAKFGITHFDFFSLDVEGAELGVLQSIALDCISFSVIAVESDVEKDASQKQEIHDLLTGKGYKFVRHLLRNDWFIHHRFRPNAAPSKNVTTS